MSAAKKATISERAQRLAEIPASEVRPQCEGICSFLLVDVNDERRIWRCDQCLRYIEAPVSRLHEIEWKKKRTSFEHGAPERAPLPDQSSLFDLLGDEGLVTE